MNLGKSGISNSINASTAAGTISGKNNEPTTVVMDCTFADVKDLYN